jgi:hypothetical protein
MNSEMRNNLFMGGVDVGYWILDIGYWIGGFFDVGSVINFSVHPWLIHR